jgi:hypothetical protein
MNDVDVQAKRFISGPNKPHGGPSAMKGGWN